jgi:hypothetical protein
MWRATRRMVSMCSGFMSTVRGIIGRRQHAEVGATCTRQESRNAPSMRLIAQISDSVMAGFWSDTAWRRRTGRAGRSAALFIGQRASARRKLVDKKSPLPPCRR